MLNMATTHLFIQPKIFFVLNKLISNCMLLLQIFFQIQLLSRIETKQYDLAGMVVYVNLSMISVQYLYNKTMNEFDLLVHRVQLPTVDREAWCHLVERKVA